MTPPCAAPVPEENHDILAFVFLSSILLDLLRSEWDRLSGGTFSPGGFKKGSATEVLVLNGGADPKVTAQDITALKANAASAGIHLRFVDYPGALHAFTDARASDLGRRFGMPIAYDAAADQASWSELSNLIRHGLPKN